MKRRVSGAGLVKLEGNILEAGRSYEKSKDFNLIGRDGTLCFPVSNEIVLTQHTPLDSQGNPITSPFSPFDMTQKNTSEMKFPWGGTSPIPQPQNSQCDIPKLEISYSGSPYDEKIRDYRLKTGDSIHDLSIIPRFEEQDSLLYDKQHLHVSQVGTQRKLTLGDYEEKFSYYDDSGKPKPDNTQDKYLSRNGCALKRTETSQNRTPKTQSR
jgi:hypothetical protein